MTPYDNDTSPTELREEDEGSQKKSGGPKVAGLVLSYAFPPPNGRGVALALHEKHKKWASAGTVGVPGGSRKAFD